MSLRYRISVEDYLEEEKENSIRHEYVNGHVFAMAGASDRHNLIAGNVYARLRDMVSAGPCQAFISDMKIMAEPGIFYYPDLVLASDPPDSDLHVLRQPILIIEVSSPSTERTDRFEKLPAYKRITGLQECGLISEAQMLVEVHRRVSGDWQAEIVSRPEDLVRFESVDSSLTLKDIYRNAGFEGGA